MRFTAKARLLFVALAALFALLASGGVVSADPTAATSLPFMVIVHPSNPNHAVDRNFVGEAFLKKTTRWPNGEVIRPVDLSPDSPVRERFSQDLLKRSVAAVKSYWQQMIFSGRDVPPPELANEDDVVRYVQKHTGAIGYVSGNARLGDTRVVTVR
jgi:hypothetical protein